MPRESLSGKIGFLDRFLVLPPKVRACGLQNAITLSLHTLPEKMRMGILTFDIEQARRIFDHAAVASRHRVTVEQLYDPALYTDGKITIQDDGRPDDANLDFSLVPPQVFLVKQDGVYLESAGLPALTAMGLDIRAYAEGCNPRHDVDWAEIAHTLLGHSDLTMPIPVQWFSDFTERMPLSRKFTLEVTGATISSPRPPRE